MSTGTLIRPSKTISIGDVIELDICKALIIDRCAMGIVFAVIEPYKLDNDSIGTFGILDYDEVANKVNESSDTITIRDLPVSGNVEYGKVIRLDGFLYFIARNSDKKCQYQGYKYIAAEQRFIAGK